MLFLCIQTRNPHAVQPHLRKCFDAIAKLEFGVKFPESELELTEEGNLVERDMSFQTRDMLQAKLAKTAKPEDLTTDIVAMLSPEGERVNLGKVNVILVFIIFWNLKFLITADMLKKTHQ